LKIATGVNASVSVSSDELDTFRKLSLQSEAAGVIDYFDEMQKEECEDERRKRRSGRVGRR